MLYGAGTRVVSRHVRFSTPAATERDIFGVSMLRWILKLGWRGGKIMNKKAQRCGLEFHLIPNYRQRVRAIVHKNGTVYVHVKKYKMLIPTASLHLPDCLNIYFHRVYFLQV